MRRFRDKRLYQRGESRFIWAKLRDGSGTIKPVSTRCTDETAASLFCDEWERKAVDPSYRRATTATLETGIADFLIELERKKRSPKTVSIAKTKLGHFVRLWGVDWPLLRISNDLVLRYIDQRDTESVVRYTVKKELDHLRRMLAWAKFRGYFPVDLDTIFPPNFSGEHKPRSRWLTREQAMKLLAHLPPHRAAHIAFILATGARWGESVRACRADVSVSLGLVHMRGTKTELATDVVPLSALTIDFMVFALEKAPASNPLFAKWSAGSNGRDIHAACRRAELPLVSPNDLRRSFGRWYRDAFIAQGKSKESAAELVGLLLRHSTDKLAQTTYAKVSAGDILGQVKALTAVSILTAETTPTTPTEANHLMNSSDYQHARSDSNGRHSASKASGLVVPQDPRSVGNKQAHERRRNGQSVAEVSDSCNSRGDE